METDSSSPDGFSFARVLRVSCGGNQRDLRGDFEKYGVALLGRGDQGDWRVEPDKSKFLNEQRALAAFGSAAVGDLVVMNDGAQIRSVGVVAEPYAWVPEFANVQGWDMQHCLRVRWVPSTLIPETGVPRIQSPRGSCRWLQEGNREAADWARTIANEALDRNALPDALPDLPVPREALSVEAVPPCLTEVIATAKTLNHAAREIRAWADLPSEHETVALLVVPLLLAAGWQPVQLALEWRRIDVAIFDGALRNEHGCRLLVEAKRFNGGFAGARYQAFRYAETHGLNVPICTTDGFDWWLYRDRLDADPVRAYLPVLDDSAIGFFERFGSLCTPQGQWPS